MNTKNKIKNLFSTLTRRLLKKYGTYTPLPPRRDIRTVSPFSVPRQETKHFDIDISRIPNTAQELGIWAI